MAKQETMSDKINKTVGDKTMTAIEILNALHVAFAYKAEYAHHIQDMANKGELMRTWKQDGTPQYARA